MGIFNPKIVLFILIFTVQNGFSQDVTNFFVSLNGNDKNPGTLEKPFVTIQKAQQAVRQINRKMKNNIVIYLREAKYQLSEPLIFDHRDSGQNGHLVIYKAYEKEKVIISGGERISNWQKSGHGIYKASVDSEFRQLYVNDKRAIRARTPNKGVYHRLKIWNERDQEIIIQKNLIQNWKKFNQIEMIVQLHWSEAILPLDSFEKFGNYAHVIVQEPERDLVFRRLYPIKSENEAFHFENAKEFLDQPGEWYYNSSERSLYYWPRSGEELSTAEVIIPQLETLVRIEGKLEELVQNLEFSGITFSHSGWILPKDTGMLNSQAGFYSIKVEPNNVQYFARPPAAVYVTGANNIKFVQNIFSHLGSSALDLHLGVSTSKIQGNIFYDISGNGVMLAEFSAPNKVHTHVYNPTDRREICVNDTISNNLITQIGLDYPGSCGIACGFPQAVIIEHNEIFNLPYSGISVGWSWMNEDNVMKNNQIRYNHIYNVLQLLCDGGGIYTLSKQPNSFIKENYIHDIYRSKWAVGSRNNGIFLDQGSNGITLEHNVFKNIQEENIRHNQTNKVIYVENETRDKQVIANSGLQPEFRYIKDWINND